MKKALYIGHYLSISFGTSLVMASLTALCYSAVAWSSSGTDAFWNHWTESTKVLLNYLFVITAFVLVGLKIASFKFDGLKRFFENEVDILRFDIFHSKPTPEAMGHKKIRVVDVLLFLAASLATIGAVAIVVGAFWGLIQKF